MKASELLKALHDVDPDAEVNLFVDLGDKRKIFGPVYSVSPEDCDGNVLLCLCELPPEAYARDYKYD